MTKLTLSYIFSFTVKIVKNLVLFTTSKYEIQVFVAPFKSQLILRISHTGFAMGGGRSGERDRSPRTLLNRSARRNQMRIKKTVAMKSRQRGRRWEQYSLVISSDAGLAVLLFSTVRSIINDHDLTIINFIHQNLYLDLPSKSPCENLRTKKLCRGYPPLEMRIYPPPFDHEQNSECR
jgi:hypothetical protein